ncbi:MAG: PilN domain-containing protein [Desulfosporosinus sp.]|nr:PilN domain-containing protein [Desulfosporosinus sp.]
MKDINLLSLNDQKNEREFMAIGKLMVIVFAAILLVSLIGYGTLDLIQWKYTAEEVAIEQRIRIASPIVLVKKDLQVKQEKVKQLSGIIDTMDANTTLNTRITDGIAGVMPDNIFLLNYAVDKSGKLNLLGKSKDMDSIAYFVAKLKGTGLFSDVYLSNISSNTSDSSNSGSSGYNFSALLKLK